MAEVPKHKAADAADTKPAKPEPPKPIAVGDMIDGWTVDSIDGPNVLLANGAERRSRPLADLERERETAAKVLVGDVIDGWTVQAINSPTDVVVTQGPERRTLTLQDLERAKQTAQAQTNADLARVKADQAHVAPAPRKP